MIQVIYATGSVTGNEYATDLGSISTLLGGVSTPGSSSLLANNNLFGLATSAPLNNYQVAYFAVPPGASTVYISGSLSGSSSYSGKKSTIASDSNGVVLLYNGTGLQTGTGATLGLYWNTVSQTSTSSYTYKMNADKTSSVGTFAGFQTTATGEATISGNPVYQELYYYSNPNSAVAGVGAIQIKTLANGQTELINSAAATPVPPVLSKQFGGASIPLYGSTALNFVVQNNNTTTLTGVGFSDTLPAGLVVSTPNGLTGSCGSGTIIATQGTSIISLSGATLASSTSCKFSVNVMGIAAGNQQNTTSNVTSNEGGSGNTASANIQVISPPTVAESFSPISIPLQTTTSLTFTITNLPANTAALTGVAFSDTLPIGITVVDSSSAVCGGTLTTTAATGLITLSGANITINSQCQFPVTTTGTAVGYYTNTTGNVTSIEGGTGNTAVANLTVNDGTDFIGTPTSGSIPLYVNFTDESINNPTSWLWDFGDGSNSTVQNPVHNYTQQGSFTVSLTATGTGGPITMPKTGYISVTPCGNQPVMIDATPAYFATIQDAFNSALTSGEAVRVQAMDMPENSLSWDQNISVVLSGGYGCDFTYNPGFTTVHGTLTIKAGTMNVYNVILQ